MMSFFDCSETGKKQIIEGDELILLLQISLKTFTPDINTTTAVFHRHHRKHCHFFSFVFALCPTPCLKCPIAPPHSISSKVKMHLACAISRCWLHAWNVRTWSSWHSLEVMTETKQRHSEAFLLLYLKIEKVKEIERNKRSDNLPMSIKKLIQVACI